MIISLKKGGIRKSVNLQLESVIISKNTEKKKT